MSPNTHTKRVPFIDPSWLRGIDPLTLPVDPPAPVRSSFQDLIDATRRLELGLQGLPRSADGGPAPQHAAAVAATASALATVQAASWMALGQAPAESEADRPVRGALRFREVVQLVPPPPGFNDGSRHHPPLPDQRQPEPIPYRRPFVALVSSAQALPGWENDVPLEMRVFPQFRVLAGLAVLAAVLAGVGAASTFLLLDHREPQAVPPPVALVPASPVNPLDLEENHQLIEATVRGFHQARTVEEKAAFIRGGASLLPRLQAYYSTHPLEAPVEALHRDTFGWLEVAGRPVVHGLLTTTAGEIRQFTVERENETFRLDWQAHTGWKGLDWGDFLARRPIEPTSFCVTAVPDSLYVTPFAKEEEWISLRLEDISRRQAAWGFLRRDHPAAAFLLAGFRRSSEAPAPRRFTLSLRSPPAVASSAGTTPVMEILDVEHEGWFDPRRPQDEDPAH